MLSSLEAEAFCVGGTLSSSNPFSGEKRFAVIKSKRIH
jgi:hypothetical protein